jgi:hydroxyacylglutathione hydrolase
MILTPVAVGPLQANCYILAEAPGGKALIIDPGYEEKKIQKALDEDNLKPEAVLNTHGHIDHIGCDEAFGVPVYVHSLDLKMLRDASMNLSDFLDRPFTVSSSVRTLEDGQELSFGALKLKVIHTPGHTPGGICLLLLEPKSDILFSGDTLFYHSIGRADFSGADPGQLVSSIREKLFTLSPGTVVYPGHGVPTTIKEEKEENPFL